LRAPLSGPTFGGVDSRSWTLIAVAATAVACLSQRVERTGTVAAPASPAAPAPTPAALVSAAPPRTPGDAFAQRVRPILATRCDPCHNPGGRMYDRLPFDDPEVVKSHREGVLRRLKGEDRETVLAWMDGKS
jgi:hypothetical protein